MEKKQFDISTLEIKWPSEQQRAEYELKPTAGESRCMRLLEAIELIDTLKRGDLSRASKWIEKHKERLTDAYALNEIISMAMTYGVSDYKSEISDARHQDNRAQHDALLKRWHQLKAEGVTKNRASIMLAKEFSSKESTIRKKLQGI